MKNLLKLFATLVAVVLLGMAVSACGDDDDEPDGSGKISKSQLEGLWAVVTQDYNEDDYSLDYNSEDYNVDEIREFTSSGLCKQYFNENHHGFMLKGGYLYDCDMSDFTLFTTSAYSVNDGQMFLAGFACAPVKITNNVMLIREGMDYTLYKRLKGFKEN